MSELYSCELIGIYAPLMPHSYPVVAIREMIIILFYFITQLRDRDWLVFDMDVNNGLLLRLSPWICMRRELEDDSGWICYHDTDVLMLEELNTENKCKVSFIHQ